MCTNQTTLLVFYLLVCCVFFPRFIFSWIKTGPSFSGFRSTTWQRWTRRNPFVTVTVQRCKTNTIRIKNTYTTHLIPMYNCITINTTLFITDVFRLSAKRPWPPTTSTSFTATNSYTTIVQQFASSLTVIDGALGLLNRSRFICFESFRNAAGCRSAERDNDFPEKARRTRTDVRMRFHVNNSSIRIASPPVERSNRRNAGTPATRQTKNALLFYSSEHIIYLPKHCTGRGLDARVAEIVREASRTWHRIV